MPWTVGEDGKPAFVAETPNRVAPPPAPPPAPEATEPASTNPEDTLPPSLRAQQSRGDAVATLKGIASTAGASALSTIMAPGNLFDIALQKTGLGGRGGGAASGGKAIEEAVRMAGGDAAAREHAESQRKFAAEHPYLHGGAELAGQVLGGAAFGGVGEAAEALGLGRAGAAVATGAVEGAAQNASTATEAAYIKNSALTGEQMLAAMGWGALIGGGTGLAVSEGGRLLFGRAGSRGATPFDSPRVPDEGGLGELVGAGESAGARAAGEASGFGERFGEKLRGLAENRAAKAIGARGPEFRNLGTEKVSQIARDVLDGTLEDGTPIFRAVQSKEELVGNLVRAKTEAGEALGALRDKVNSYIENEAPSLRPKVSDVADRIEQEVIAPLEQSVIPQVQAKAREVRGVVDGLRSLGDDMPLERLQAERELLDGIIYPKAPPGSKGLPPPPPASAAELQAARSIIEEHIEATVDKATIKMGGGEIGKLAELKAKYASYRAAAQMASKAEATDAGSRFLSPTDYLAGIGGAALHGGPAGVAAAVAHHAVREHGSAVLAVLADRLAQTVDRKLTKGIDGFFERALGQAAFARPMNDVTRAAARSLPRPSAAMAAGALTPLTLFMGKHKDKQAAYQARASEVLAASANFGASVRGNTEKTLGDLPTKAPKLAASIVTTATRGAQYLSTKLPAPLVNAQSFTPYTSRLPISDIEMSQFARSWAAVANPASTLESFRRGTLTPEQVDATRAVYPELYQSIVEKVQTRLRDLDAKGKFIPYSARLELDLLLGMNGAGEPTASPEFVALFQQISAQSKASGGQEPGPTPPQRPINIASRLKSGRDAFDPGAENQ